MRSLAFGDYDAGIWGAAWGPFALVATFAGEFASPTLTTEGDSWKLVADGVELVASPLADGLEQPCRVSGRATVGGSELSLECFGRRAERDGVELTGHESVREVSAWFEPDVALELVAVRPPKARGHDADMVSAVLLEEGHALQVADPRLSTTYGADGLPASVNLELWIEGEGEDEQFPRRVAGEIAGARVRRELDGVVVDAAPFRMHARGRDGLGAYLLMRAR